MTITHRMLVEGDIDALGYIPEFLNPVDPRPAREQFATNYVGGWNPFQGFRVSHLAGDAPVLTYPGDPPMRPRARILFRDERIHVYPHAWVMIVQPDGSHEIARMD